MVSSKLKYETFSNKKMQYENVPRHDDDDDVRQTETGKSEMNR